MIDSEVVDNGNNYNNYSIYYYSLVWLGHSWNSQ